MCIFCKGDCKDAMPFRGFKVCPDCWSGLVQQHYIDYCRTLPVSAQIEREERRQRPMPSPFEEPKDPSFIHGQENS